jgi:hypothetical protein
MSHQTKIFEKEHIELLHPHYPHKECYVFDNDLINVKIGLFNAVSIHMFTAKVPFNGIYFLFHKKELVYIGQSINIIARLRQHEGVIPFDSYGMLLLQNVQNLDSIENRFIEICKPFLNIKNAKYNH